MKMQSREKSWLEWTEKNSHDPYLKGEAKSEYLVGLIGEVAPGKDSPVLELGCNVGRNLEYLRRAGYTQLGGIEISPRAAPIRRDYFPELELDYYQGPIEEKILHCRPFDIVFSMAVLQHVHPDSDWIFAKIARVARVGIVTIEDEVSDRQTLYPRDYGEIFRGLGLRETRAEPCDHIKGFRANYIARQFVK